MPVRRLPETVRSRRKTSKARAIANGGYRKGENTRERILNVALKAFGEEPFAAVTTRRISEAAGVSLPALRYYFAGKEGLYRACAAAIVERYRHHTAVAAAEAAKALDEDCPAETARVHLARIRGCSDRDPAARIQALPLISSLLAFQSGRNVSLRAMHWSTIGRAELAVVLSALDAQIDGIGRNQS